jgi:hypothetical protein
MGKRKTGFSKETTTAGIKRNIGRKRKIIIKNLLFRIISQSKIVMDFRKLTEPFWKYT